MRRLIALAFASLLFALCLFALVFGAPPRARAQADVSSAILQVFENWVGTGVNGAASRINASSGDVANAVATATLPAVAGKTTYITGFDVNAGGATAASVVVCTVTGLEGGTESRDLAVVSGATAGETLTVRYPAPLPASAADTAIAASCPALGSGNAHATVNAYGYQN